MTISVHEIRERADVLRAALARERYETRAGLKERSSFEELYAEHRLLLGPRVLPAVQRALAEVRSEERRRLGALLAWLSNQQVEAALAHLEDQLRGWEATATVSVGERTMPFRRVPALIARTADREARLAWAAARANRLEDAAALRLDLLHSEREAIDALGLGPYVEARERLSRLNLVALQAEAARVLAETDSTHTARLEGLARRHLDLPEALTESDVSWLRQLRWEERRFVLQDAVEPVSDALIRLGLEPNRRKRVEFDLGVRAHKVPGSFSAVLAVPHRVVIVVAPDGGWQDAAALLHQWGRTLHLTYTASALPLEDRCLGDTAVTETFALLFRGLLREPGWVEATFDLSGGALSDFVAVQNDLWLFDVRRDIGRLIWELELARAERPAETRGRFVEVMGRATRVGHDPRTFLEVANRGFWAARRFRAWMLTAILQAELRDRFGEDWFHNPAAGPYLAEIMSSGLREDAGEIARQLGAEGLSSDRLLEQVAA